MTSGSAQMESLCLKYLLVLFVVIGLLEPVSCILWELGMCWIAIYKILQELDSKGYHMNYPAGTGTGYPVHPCLVDFVIYRLTTSHFFLGIARYSTAVVAPSGK